MKRDEIVRFLAAHRQEIAKFGVKSLAFFGSAARDEAGPMSDVDILVEFEGPETFDSYMELKFFLEDSFGCPVDLVTRETLKPRLKPYIEKEIFYVP